MNRLKKFLLMLFLCTSIILSLNVINVHGKNRKVFISVKVHNCCTNTTDSTHTVSVPKKWMIGQLKQFIEAQPNTKIQIKRFIFSQRYVSNFDTFEDLCVKNLDTVIALGDSKKKFVIKALPLFSEYRISKFDISTEDELTHIGLKDLKHHREFCKILDLELMKMEIDPHIFHQYISQEQKRLLNDDSGPASSDLNLDYEQASAPIEDPLPVTLQF